MCRPALLYPDAFGRRDGRGAGCFGAGRANNGRGIRSPGWVSTSLKSALTGRSVRTSRCRPPGRFQNPLEAFLLERKQFRPPIGYGAALPPPLRQPGENGGVRQNGFHHISLRHIGPCQFKGLIAQRAA